MGSACLHDLTPFESDILRARVRAVGCDEFALRIDKVQIACVVLRRRRRVRRDTSLPFNLGSEGLGSLVQLQRNVIQRKSN